MTTCDGSPGYPQIIPAPPEPGSTKLSGMVCPGCYKCRPCTECHGNGTQEWFDVVTDCEHCDNTGVEPK